MPLRTVLSIDDDPHIQEVIRMICEEADMECDTVFDIDVAKMMLKERPYKTILMDINIGGRNSGEIIQFLKSEPNKSKNANIIILSAFITTEFVKKHQETFQGMLLKPFDNEELLQLLENSFADKLEDPRVVGEVEPVDVETPFKVPDIQEKVNTVVKQVKKLKDLSKLFKNSGVGKGNDYLDCHVGMLINVCSAIAIDMQWSTDKTLEKFVFSAYLHDASFQATPSLVESENESIKKLEERGDFDRKTLKLIEKHPIEASDLVEKYQNIPPDVGVIIRQHHEKPDGTGYPQGVSQSRIMAMSAIFIVAHDLVDYIIRNRNWKMQDYIDTRKSTFARGKQFRLIFDSLERLAKKYKL